MAISKNKISDKSIRFINFDYLKSLLFLFIPSKPSTTTPPPSAATGTGTMPMNPINIKVQTGKEKDWGTIIMIATAYLIWLIDLSPFNIFGKPYSGFIFNNLILSQVNWIGVATSLIVTVFLMYDIAMSLKKRGEDESIRYLIEMGLIAVINGSTLATYYWQAFSNPVVNISFLGISVFTVGYIIYRKGFTGLHGADLITYWTMVLTISFFWTLWNWTSNIKAIIHFSFILFFMLFYLKKKEDVNVSRLYLFTAIFLIIDFFSYSFDLIIPYTKLSFPIIVLVTAFYCVFFTESTFGLVNGIVWTAVLIAAWALPSAAYASEFGVDIAEKQSGGFAGFTDSISKAWKSFNDKLNGRLDVATGGFYSSQVEKNQFEPLGVFLEKVRAAQPRFYPDEDVTIWSSINSRTLSDPAVIKFNCYRYVKDNKPIGIMKKDTTTGEYKIDPSEGDITPKKPFTVYTLEQKDVECTFKQDSANPKFQAGTNPVTLTAEYNFVTSAYQKVYFIDRARHQAMIRENLDPLKEFGITDRNPSTFYTNGPVDLKLVIQNPVTVDLDSQVYPNLGITLTNRDKITDKQGNPVGQWQGKILNIQELAIIVPKGIEIAGGNCKPVSFTDYKKDDCMNSCRNTCKETCGEYDGTKKQECIDNCNNQDSKAEITRKCDDECTILFKDDQGLTDYTGYQLDKNSKEFKTRENEFKDIGRYTQFGCRLILSKDVLEPNVPITTKFIRVRTKYNYLLESTYSVPIEQVPTSTTVEHITYTPSNTDIDTYLIEKKSPMQGLGQCMKDAEQRTGVPSILMLGVAGQEGSFAKSKLALEFKNIFSITCGKYATSGKCTFTDKNDCCRDYVTYKGTTKSFRRYRDFCESVNDFADLISNPLGLYAEAMKYTNQPEKMAQEMIKAGYAEEGSSWANGVIAVMTEAAARITTIAKTSEAKSGG